MTSSTDEYDLTVAEARLRGTEGPRWIGIRDGSIAAVSETPLPGARVVEADGALVTPSFVNAHMHLDKVYTLDLVGDAALAAYSGAGMDAALASIELASVAKDSYDEGRIEANARRCLRSGLQHGLRHVLAFADVDSRAGLRGVRPLLRLREEFRGVIDLQVVAFPQDGLLCDPGAEDLVREAVALGADVVGGIPWIEHTDTDAREHVRRMCELAAKHGRRVAMLVDDAGDPWLRTTEMLASELIRLGLRGRGVANHARALSQYSKPSLQRLARLARDAGLGFVSDPHTGALHLPVFELRAQGLPVALGQDDCEDAYYPFGRQNMLEVVFLAAHVLGASAGERLEALFDAVTTTAAQVLGIGGHRLAVGAPADLVVLNGSTLREAVAHHLPPRFVVASGQVVAESSSDSWLAR
ncbi:amidohydrolase family protein [Pseudonocardia acaciae]|uniref:amidohydrolase family protein n=1 Tax=Pseudonocardia acaciae TaxID=551276 RepID=UPI000490CA36|nr:amidohydrolase family protein [Pseudonocardia acaciae]